MGFSRDCDVTAVRAQSRITHTILHCVQAHIALTKTSSSGGCIYG